MDVGLWQRGWGLAIPPLSQEMLLFDICWEENQLLFKKRSRSTIGKAGASPKTSWAARKRKRRRRRRRKPPLCRKEWEVEPVGRRGVETGEYVHNIFNKILKKLIKMFFFF